MRTLLPCLLVIVACSRESQVVVGSDTVTKRMLISRKLDLLFVIDNSASTSDKQTVFAQNFLRFVQALDAFPTGRPDLHIGVVTSTVDIGHQGYGPSCPSPDPADDGLLQNTPRTPGCPTPAGRFIEDLMTSSGTRATNYTGQLEDAFACIAQVGATGCGFEAPLEAMKRALDGSRPENAGFLRDDAYLAIVILTDEDDASIADPAIFDLGSAASGPDDFRAQPLYAYTCDHPISADAPDTYTGCVPRLHGYLADPASYVQFLATLKDPSQTVVALIAGDPSDTIMTGPITSVFYQPLALLPSCEATINGDQALGRPAIRLHAFSSAFHDLDHDVFETVCQADYSNALAQIGQTLFTMMSPCLEGLLDLADMDAANPGIQPQCRVIENGQDMPTCPMTTEVFPDPAGPRPCWWTHQNPACTTGSMLEIEFERVVPPSPTTTTDVTCRRL